MPSYAHGPSPIPLLGETIGENLRRTAERFPDRDALVVRSQRYRATYRQLWDETTAVARALLATGIEPGERVGIWAPNRFEWVIAQYAAARAGAILVNVNPAYKAAELRYALRQSGVRLLLLARAFRAVGLRGPARGGAGRLPRPARDRGPRRRVGRRSAPAAPACPRRRSRRASAGSSSTTPSTSSTRRAPPALPRAPPSPTTTSSTTATSSAKAMGYTEQDRVCIPVPFYHCFGMVIGNLACTTHGACIVTPGEAFDPLLTLETVSAERCTSLYGVPSMFIAELAHPRFHEFDLSLAPHRHDGGRPLPGRGDAQGAIADAHARDDDRLRHDGDLARLRADGAQRSAGATGRHRRPGPPPRRDQDRGPGDGRHRSPRRAGRVLHAGLQRDARATGTTRRPRARPSTPRAGCTPATSRPWTTRAT